MRYTEVFPCSVFPPPKLPVACCLLPVACFLLPVSCCLLPVACCLLPVPCSLFPLLSLDTSYFIFPILILEHLQSWIAQVENDKDEA
ncbi:MAG: hypothetical protein F6K65_00130 [Moorea sp. SIO3C2]|nr:hypothetical protein [Moorena sp. SIO3C2]